MKRITQEQVNSEMNRLIEIGLMWEDARDSKNFESKAYWDCHDQAVEYRNKAIALMPAGS